MRAIRVHEYGGPEVLRYEDVPLPEPGPGEVRVKIEAAGVNFIDIYHRTGLYPNPLPFTLGVEGAGVVEAIGPDVADVRVGDRVAYALALGAYAERAIVPAWKLVPLPETIDFPTAAAAMVQGLTAHYLTHSTYSLKPGDTALVHAAAGGTGLLIVQMAKLRGARVIGTVSTEEKAQRAREAGADEVILYTQQDFEAEVRRLTDGRGVDVVYDSVGQATFEKSLNCLRPRGLLVLFGQSSGPVPPIDPLVLSAKGSVFLTRPHLSHYVATREELLERARALFQWIQEGQVKIHIEQLFPLAEAAEAHRILAARASMGKLLLVP
ncbi:MAG: quinone oxidoreductase [Blastocatellia bacterium]|nr:quinone oxidoreductase [Blastocatellia bacterium]MCS7156586.1 quinone oxidoreductase [Blastocatellia bacterium]MDW8257038.1 quinone oxidoreductase [Acidobacteriota bacterium]